MNSTFIIIATGLLVVAVIDILQRKFKNPALGFVWFFVVLIFPIIGPLFYLIIRKSITQGKLRKFNPKFHHYNFERK